MNILQEYFKLRLRQIGRLILQIGIFRTLFLLAIVLVLFFGIYKSVVNYFLPVLFLVAAYCYYNSRSDKGFLKMMYSNRYILYWIENLLISIPFISISCLKGFYYDLFIYPIFILITPFLQTIKINRKALPIPFFRKGSYEYQTMLRRSYLFILILYILSFLGLYNGNERVFYSACFMSSMLWLVSLVKPEPLIYILNYSNSRDLIKNKIQNIVYNTLVLYLPFFIISIWGGWTVIGMTAYLYWVTICSTIGINILKYCLSQNEFLTIIITLFVLLPLAIMSIIYPIFIVFNILLNIFIIFRASDKLNSFFSYDNNTTIN